ncbi:Pimeloyl-ACP methyl ester carboxylesterase [Tenacibaculum sp. MAR_2009_124]|uniref:alpha/beta fold hydrolase n=1 Tax=Tenacibaculum sp. MAR_2009_124 TaxID=1250059 RepID=UPI000895DD52|nr:alpha/beta hydrolase [Tenacibaculum sp. MAR_2009_124]SEC38265.1 Pimeloyl-ACP methyl ester carboxylesterase [Tenacibaculum sp. MAR_2009_124]
MTNVYFISGTMCTEDLWQFIFPYLKNSTPIHIDITSASSFEEINNIILKTIESPAIIVGFSLGGFSAMNFAYQYPENVEKLIIVAANSKGLDSHEINLRKSTIKFLEKHSYKGISQARVQQFLHPNNHHNQEIVSIIKKMDASLGKNVLIKQLKATSKRIDITQHLSNLNKPILFVSAENDSLVNPLEVKQLSNKIPKSTYVNLKQCGHMIPLEKPKELVYLLSSFLNL